MGLFLRYYLFHGVSSEDVRGALQAFYASRGRPLRVLDPAMGGSGETLDIHLAENDWVIVDLDRGWEWKERREAQLFVSMRLWCPGFLIFVYDGDYWGYEFFDQGRVLDHFVQQQNQAEGWFPGQDCQGNSEMLARHLPFLDIEVIAPYLKQKEDYGDPPELKGKVRPGDEFDRFDSCAVLDFLRAIGIQVSLRHGRVTENSPVVCSLGFP